jgi:lipopolysaccharide/colanic/teichoic acid biosynthesis glycosyltransferase
MASPAADAVVPPVPSPRPRSELVCRVANVLIASVALGLSAPLLFVVAAVIKCTSRGPILYRQTRVGLDRRTRPSSQNYTLYDRRARDVGGRAFTIYKFRTMRVDAEAGVGAVWATRRDPRVTPVGRFMRKSRIDEIPQLWNVIRGDMNIVGPRPERPRLVAQLREHIAEYPLRHRARPGITGWAQINHAYDGSIDDVRVKVRYDLQYLERQSMTEDLRIMVRTIPVILLRRGAN